MRASGTDAGETSRPTDADVFVEAGSPGRRAICADRLEILSTGRSGRWQRHSQANPRFTSEVPGAQLVPKPLGASRLDVVASMQIAHNVCRNWPCHMQTMTIVAQIPARIHAPAEHIRTHQKPSCVSTGRTK